MNKKKKIIIIVVAIILVVAVVAGVVVYQLNKDNTVEYGEETSESVEADRANDTHEEPENYATVIEYTENATESDVSIESTTLDENAIMVTNGAIVNLSSANIIRSSEDTDDENGAKQYGIGAAVLAKNGILNITNSTIKTSGAGATGVFAYTDGIISLADTIITTTGDNAGGIHTSTEGSITAMNCTVSTSGVSSAAIRSEADGGLMQIEGGTYSTSGTNSPAIYSLATVVAKDVILTADNSEAVNIDGAHSVTLENCDITSNMPYYLYDSTRPGDEARYYWFGDRNLAWVIGISQSQEKDETLLAQFSMTGGTITANNGGIIYVSNAVATITLENVTINPSESNDFFLQCTGNNNPEPVTIWGTVGSNGGTCDITIINQEINGDVIWDSISRVDFEITEESTFKGAVIDDETAVGDSEDIQATGSCSITIDESSTWIVTGNSTVSSLENAGTIVDENGNTVTIQSVNGKVYVEGNSSYVVTVNTYSE